ncbi:DUF1129 domain-containing protein [Streptococcus dentapri]|uniref:DUF1129 domain-containing protein n=1 Tax=Streptococcus dentapri TaxID=573564 RepID=A0ABV8D2S1_9STRE
MDLQELTKKNQEFVTIASHQLRKDGKSEKEIEQIFDDIMPSILENQKKGITARNLLGAPTIWAKSHSETTSDNSQGGVAATNKNPWLMWLDSSLMLLGFFGVLYGLMALTDKNYQHSYGILTTLIIAFSGGAVLYALYYFVYQHAGKPKEERPKLWKSLLYMAVFTLIWIAFVGISSLIPAQLNPVLPGIATIIIGGLSFGLKYFLKKRYNIQSSLAAQPQPERQKK